MVCLVAYQFLFLTDEHRKTVTQTNMSALHREGVMADINKRPQASFHKQRDGRAGGGNCVRVTLSKDENNTIIHNTSEQLRMLCT